MSLLEDFANAIERGDSTQVELLLASGSIDVNARLPRRFNPPPLVLAVQRTLCHVEIVELLLKAGARVDDVNDRGHTACWAAASHHNAHAMPALLKRRPNLELADNRHDRTPLQVALDFQFDARIATLLLNAGASLDRLRHSPVLCDLAAWSTSALQALLDRGVLINELRDRENGTPLHAAAADHKCDSAVVNMLANVCCVDLEAFNMKGDTCTCTAARFGNAAALRCFLQAGADANRVSNNQLTLLQIVSDYECAIVLLAAGADVHARKRLLVDPSVPVTTNMLHAFVAAGDADTDANVDVAALARRGVSVDARRVAGARRDISKVRLDFVRGRALQVCIGLQSIGLDALQMCEILQHACGPLAPLIAFHHWWKIATTVKHFL